jgi:hypothetical protein
MNLERRIRKLERYYHGDDDLTGITWEEFLHIFYASHPERFKELAKTDYNMRYIMDSPPPRRIHRLLQSCRQMREKGDKPEENSLETAAVTDSSTPGETGGTSACSLPVLAGPIPSETTAAVSRNQVAPSARPRLQSGKVRAPTKSSTKKLPGKAVASRRGKKR